MRYELIPKEKVVALKDMLASGHSVKEIGEYLDISDTAIYFYRNVEALKAFESSVLLGFADVINSNLDVDPALRERQTRKAKRFAEWLARAGCTPGQIHVSTGLSIYQSRAIIRELMADNQIEEPIKTIPQSLTARLVMTIFARHYKYISAQTNSNNSIDLGNIIASWTRTLEEIKDWRIERNPDFDPQLLELGLFFEVAKALRGNAYKARNPSDEFSEGKRKRFRIFQVICSHCGQSFIATEGGRRVMTSVCPGCELKGLTNVRQKRGRGGR